MLTQVQFQNNYCEFCSKTKILFEVVETTVETVEINSNKNVFEIVGIAYL